MKSINVIDLDKTLIPFDSFRYLVVDEMKAFNIKVILLVAVRKLKLIKAKTFKNHLIKTLKLDTNTKLNRKMVDLINSSIDREILEEINQESDDNTINILCSASADSYVKDVAKHLGWEGYGSFTNEGNFYHMYGENKLKFIEENFPKSNYNYNFAISDSSSDLDLLKIFKKHRLIIL
jgi:phosphoserine phosphatase